MESSSHSIVREKKAIFHLMCFQVMKENFESIESLKWQYFGSEEGIHVTFPSRLSKACDDYDPRFR